MPNRVPIPWVAGGGAAFLGYLALMAWCGLQAPADLGIASSIDGGSMIIAGVREGSPAAAAGLRHGDRLLARGGIPVRTRFDWMSVAANWDGGRPVEIEVLRGGESLRVRIEVSPDPWSRWNTRMIAAACVLWGARLFALIAALMLLVSGPKSATVLVGAWFLASTSVASVVLLPGMAATWRILPRAASALLWAPAVSPPLLPVLFFVFMARFPAALLTRRWQWAAALAPGALVVAYISTWLFAVVYTPERSLGFMPDWFPAAFCWVASAYIVAGIGIQLVRARGLSDPASRTRAAILGGAALIGWSVSIPIVLFDWYGTVSSVAPAFFASQSALVAVALFVASLSVLAVVLLRRRVFGFRVILRTGIRYALARRFLLSIVPVCAILLAADLFRNAERPLKEILNASAWVYVTVGTLGAVAVWRRRRWLEALDRHFFREHYQAQQILKEVGEVLRAPGNLAQVATRVVARVQSALHAEVVALMVRNEDDAEYQSIASAPAGQAPSRLPVDNRLISLVRLLGKPVELSLSSSWLLNQLPQADVEYARNARIELIAPVTVDGGSEALLIAGPKRSEQPYSSEDQDLMSAVAASLSLLLSGPVRTTVSGPMCRECPVCGTCYDSTSDSCPREGARLAPKDIPRTLAQRYRLERRLGAGGMGVVYESLDTALDRRVAVKVIHEKLVGSAEAAARFRREARAAASFSHLNIVTVYDFGLVGGTRAFLVMELLVGKTLRQTIQLCERFPMPGAMETIEAICEGIDTAHRRQMIHRDLKPENIILDERNGQITPKILDFGLIKFLSPDTAGSGTESMNTTGPGLLLGTFRYIAPEQFGGDLPHVATDLWSLGVICYEMLTGYLPFEASIGEEWRKAVLAGRFRPLTKLTFRGATTMAPPFAGAPALDEFFASALSPDPAKRPASAREFAARLACALRSGARAAGQHA